MAFSLPSIRVPPIGFAHRGARAHAPENTLEAFRLALRLGATGLESDVWLTSDGVAVLDHDGVVGSRLRRRPIAEVARSQLPAHDVKDAGAIGATVAVARAAGTDVPGRLWVCHHDWRQVAEWRSPFPDVRLVDSTRLRFLRHGPERRAAQLSDAGIDAINLHESDWSGGLSTLFHRFEVLAFGWDAQHERVLDNLLGMGLDAVYSDHTDRMMGALARRLDPTD